MKRWTLVLGLGAMAGLLGCDGDGGGGTTGVDTVVADAGADTGTTDVALQDAAAEDSTGTDAAAEDATGTDAAVEDATGTDTTVEDAAVADTAVEDTGGADGAADAGPAQDVPADDDTGPAEAFQIRVPGTHEITCTTFGGGTDTFDQPDTDHLCTFAHEGTFGQVYVQANAIGCVPGGFATPDYEVVGAWIALDGKVKELPGAVYDWGGNHHNDALTFTWGGKSYNYYHSSFGWGWRACQPMDCIQVLGAGGEVVEDGCTKERTLPVTCVLIGSDGSVPPLVDTFAPCEGDPNYQ